MAGEIQLGGGPAGGLPTSPSIQRGGPQPAQGGIAPAPGQAPPPQPGQEAVPVPPDGATQVSDALSTIMKFALAQREQGNPAVAEAMKGLIAAMGAGGGAQQLPGQAPIGPEQPLQEAPPQGIPTPQPQAGGNVPINA